MEIRRLDASLISLTAQRSQGLSEARLRGEVQRGELVMLRRGWAVDAGVWAASSTEERHVLRVLATARVSPDAVFSHVSAAALRGWPVPRADLERVHVTTPSGNGVVTAAAAVARHEVTLDRADLDTIDGLSCTSAERTVLDLARSERPETAVAIADAALRAECVGRRTYHPDRAELWRRRMWHRVEGAAGSRGIRQARFVVDFADGRAQLPGESISRLYLFRLGFRAIRVQVRVVGPAGQLWDVDFGLDDVPALGEFDGTGKYLRAEFTRGADPADIVLAEKRRENAIRAITGLPVVRWGWPELASPAALRVHLASFGIHPFRTPNPHRRR